MVATRGYRVLTLVEMRHSPRKRAGDLEGTDGQVTDPLWVHGTRCIGILLAVGPMKMCEVIGGRDRVGRRRVGDC